MQGLDLANVWDRCQRGESEVREEDLDFPDTVPMAEPCFDGECFAVLTEAQRGQVAALGKHVRLVLRNSGLPPEFLPCVEFRAGGHIIYALVGNHGSVHEIGCELISLNRQSGAHDLGPGGSGVIGPASWPFERAMVQEAHCVHLDVDWPRAESERACLRRLVTSPSGIWELYYLKKWCDKVSTFVVEERTCMDLGAFGEAEVRRLVWLHALTLLKKAEKTRAGQTGTPRSVEGAVSEKSQGARGGALDLPMMKVRLSPTADRPTASGEDRPTGQGQGRPTASGQEKQGERRQLALSGGNLQ